MKIQYNLSLADFKAVKVVITYGYNLDVKDSGKASVKLSIYTPT